VSYKKFAISKHSEKPVNTAFAGFRHSYSKRFLIVFIKHSFFHSFCPENHGEITDFGGEKAAQTVGDKQKATDNLSKNRRKVSRKTNRAHRIILPYFS